MTMQVYVGSKTQPTIFAVEGIGLDQLTARRAAIQFARARHRIADPIALSDHEAGVRMWQINRVLYAPKMPDLNGRSPMNFDNRYEPCQFD